MRGLIADLRLGGEAALGARTARGRTVLTAAGVALGVAVLLLAASIPHAVAARNARAAAITPAYAAHGQLRLLETDTQIGSTAVSGITVQAAGPHPPVPPGLRTLPAPGTMVVSPALARILRGPQGAQLARRLDARVVGTIGRGGLSGPGEVRYVRGSSQLAARDVYPDVVGFGASHAHAGPAADEDGSDTAGIVTLLVIAIVVALLVPVGVFVGTAARFGSEQRERRLAAMRLVGADAAATARVAVGEALVGALAGLLIGGALFVVGRPWAAHLSLIGQTVYASDIVPVPWLAVVIAIGVPLSAVLAALLSIRTVIVAPLGTSRRAQGARRRLLWRLVVPAIGFVMLADLQGSGRRLTSTAETVQAAAGMVLALVGLTALLPWVVEAIVRRAPDGPLPWLLAVRRLRIEGASTGRAVGAIGLAVAGAIALQIVFSAVTVQQRQLAADGAPAGAMLVHLPVDSTDGGQAIAARLRGVRGVRLAEGAATGRRGGPMIAPCATLALIAQITRCRDGDRFWLGGGDVAHEHARAVAPRPVSWQLLDPSPLLLTPAAARRAHVVAGSADVAVTLAPGDRGAADRLRDAAAAISPLATVTGLSSSGQYETYAQLRHALLAGAIVVLGMIGASLLVAGGEQLRERRRPLAVLAAFGARRSTLAWSILWQAAIPVLAGLALAVALGAALGELLTAIVHLNATYDWGAIALMVAAGAAVIAVVTTLTLPTLWRMMSAAGLRTE